MHNILSKKKIWANILDYSLRGKTTIYYRCIQKKEDGSNILRIKNKQQHANETQQSLCNTSLDKHMLN
jgi:hypothetical protein